MTEHRFHIDSSDVRRKLSRETETNRFRDLGISWKVKNTCKMVPGDPSCLQIDPRWSLDVPWVLMDPLKIKWKSTENQKNEKWKPGKLKICIMRIHDAPWVLVMHDASSGVSALEASWVLMMQHEHSWCSTSAHDASWVFLMHHEYAWCIMSTHAASRVLMMHHEYLIFEIFRFLPVSICLIS